MPITINTYCRINRNGSININTDPTFPEPLPDPNFLCVSGAGTTQVNGTYIKINENRYESSNFETTGTVLTNEYGAWGILIPGGGNPLFYLGQTTPRPQYPWQETSWTAIDGELPVPTVTIGPC